MNATAMVFDRDGLLYVTSRFDGVVYRVTPTGNMTVFVEGMGVCERAWLSIAKTTSMSGDRSGTVFKISPEGQIFVFATLEPSISAYHLAFGPDRYLYVTGPHHVQL